MKKIWDSQRKKTVALTPEERVRSWFVGVLKTQLSVPEGLIGTEVPLSIGSKKYRADILIFDRNLAPLAVVECKRPEVEINSEVLLQAAKYHSGLNVRYIFLTNGNTTYIAENKNGVFEFLSKAPDYKEMSGK